MRASLGWDLGGANLKLARAEDGRVVSVAQIPCPPIADPEKFNQALEEGLIKTFMDAGFCVTNPTCGACLGMSNGVLADGETCAATTNRNFRGRMGKGGMVHLVSPATAAASALAGCIVNSPLYEAQDPGSAS